MKHSILFLFVSILILASCDDNTKDIGMSLSMATDQATINVSADEFNVTSRSRITGDIVPRSTLGYLGKIKDPETGAYVTCDFMTQQRSMGVNQFPAESTLYKENNTIIADSCELCIYFPSYYGDSLALMNLMVHELNKPYEQKDADNITAGFNPIEEDKNISETANKWIRVKDPSDTDPLGAGIHEPMSYTITNHSISDDQRGSSTYTPYFSISLNKPYKEKGVNGKTYNNYGTYLMEKFYNPQTAPYFNTQYLFHKNICPGFYLESTGGIGSMANITITQVIVYFKTIDAEGKVTNSYCSFAGTEELMQKTSYKLDNAKIADLVTKETTENRNYTFLKNPASIYTELTLPVEEIVLGHENDTISASRLFLQRINDTASSTYPLPIPQSLLLLPTDSLSKFFKEKQLPDAKISVLASYSSKDNGYTFTNLSRLVMNFAKIHKDYINDLKAKTEEWMRADGINPDAFETPQEASKARHPYILRYKQQYPYKPGQPSPFTVAVVPVETTFSTVSSTSFLSKVTYDMSLSSTRIVRGRDELDAENKSIPSDIRLSVIYSSFK